MQIDPFCQTCITYYIVYFDNPSPPLEILCNYFNVFGEGGGGYTKIIIYNNNNSYTHSCLAGSRKKDDIMSVIIGINIVSGKVNAR